MAQDYAASVQGVAIRVCRLDAAGAPVTGAAAAGPAYVTNGFTRVAFTPEYEEGEEITEKNAAGAVCVTYKAPDTLKRVTLELAICLPDPELSEMIAGGTLLTNGGNSVGYAAAQTGTDANPNGIGLEVWSYAIANGKRASTNPYFRWVFPYAQLRLTGDRTIENGLLATVFSGFGVGNANFGDGPGNNWAYTSDRAYQYARDAAAPTGVNGYVAV